MFLLARGCFRSLRTFRPHITVCVRCHSWVDFGSDGHLATVGSPAVTFHDIVASGQHKLAATVLRCDPNAHVVVNSPAIRWNDVTFPLVTAVQNVDYAMVALLIAYGVRTTLSEEDITRVVESRWVCSVSGSSLC